MAEKAKKFKLSDFYTAPVAEKGRKVPLALPNGSPTEFYLVVMGGDAPAARKALTDAVREIRGIPEELSEEERAAARAKAVLDQRCSLIIGGALPGGFSKDAARKLLANNPGLAADVERISADPALFYARDQ